MLGRSAPPKITYVRPVGGPENTSNIGEDLSGSHRSTHIASDLASRALASQAKPQRESESQAIRIARSYKTP